MLRGNRNWLRLLVFSAALASAYTGYYLGNLQQDTTRNTALLVKPRFQLIAEDLPTALKNQLLIHRWQLVVFGDVRAPACLELLDHHRDILNRLAAYPKIQNALSLVLIDNINNSGVTAPAAWQLNTWANVVSLTPLQQQALKKRLIYNSNKNTPNQYNCNNNGTTSILISPDLTVTAILPYEEAKTTALNLKNIIEDSVNSMPNLTPSFKDRFSTALLRVLPQHLLSDAMHAIARSEITWLKNNIIKYIVKSYNVDMSQAKNEDALSYPSFNAFFTRELKDDARPFDPDAIISPTDGKVSQAGAIKHDRLIQAKDQEFSLYALLGGDGEVAQQFNNGSFATIYLAPRDYHRIHMPVSGRLRQMTFIPGDLFSVSEATTQLVPGLFARNERLVCLFDTEHGPMTVIFVGAIFVGSMQTVWAGEVKAEQITTWDYEGENQPSFKTGDEIGRFNMGSTVIVLLPEHAAEMLPERVGQPIKMGQTLAQSNSRE